MRKAIVAPTGTLTLRRLRPWPEIVRPSKRGIRFSTVLRYALPYPGLEREVFMFRLKNLPNVWRGFWRAAIATLFGIPTQFGALWLTRIHPDGRHVQYGLASLRVVTTVGAERLVDGLQSSATDLSLWKYHAFGTGSNAEAVGNTALHTELTTQYASDNTRPTGSQTENGSTVYRTVGTLDPDADVSITEHGILTQAATGGGVLLDKSLFTAVALTGATGDALQATYDFTVTAGS